MATSLESTDVVRFDVFEVDLRSAELRKKGHRIRLAPQAIQILILLLSRPGDLIARDELRQRLWAEGTFVDFEHGLNAAINKLRRALGDSADRPRHIETVTGRGYRFIGIIKPTANPIAAAAADALALPSTQAPAQRRRRRMIVAAAVVIGSATMWWVWPGVSDRQPEWTFVRLTSEGGVAKDPAISQDGSLVVYSSDRDNGNDRDPLGGGLDLYVRHVAGGAPLRLTFDGEGNEMPDFSPDGSRIAFRSTRAGAGIYEIPALGGEAKLLVAAPGLNPRFSPDGLQVAYWVGPQSVASAVPGSGTVWTVSVAGGPPQRVANGLATAQHPIWNKDNRHLLVLGYDSSASFDAAAIDWWVVDAKTSTIIRTGAYQALINAGFRPRANTRTPVPEVPSPSCWSSDDRVIFSMLIGDDTWNLWDMEVSPRTGRVVGTPRRLTTGPGNDRGACSTAAGNISFEEIERHSGLWVLPFDLAHGQPAGVPQEITAGPIWYDNPSLDAAGTKVAYMADEGAHANIWVRDLDSGRALPLAASPYVQRYPVSSASGRLVAFSEYEKDQRVVYVAAVGQPPEKVCEKCQRATDWSLDERALLVFAGNPYRIGLLDLASHHQQVIVSDPQHHVLYGRFSPDNRWISFTVRLGSSRGRIVIAPFDGDTVDQRSWMTVAEVDADDYARWSPDGRTLYFSSGRDGHSCLWGQRLDPISRQPIGAPFAVRHLHGQWIFEHGGWSAIGDRIVLPLVQTRSNIWLMSRSR